MAVAQARAGLLLRNGLALGTAGIAYVGVALFGHPGRLHPQRDGLVAAAIVCVFSQLVFHLADRRHKVRFEVKRGSLRVRGDPFGRTYPLAKLKLDQAAPADLSGPGPRALRWKLFGAGLPGYWAGEYDLGDGSGCTARVFVSDRARVLRIPTTDGQTLFLSVEDPAGFKRLLAQARAESQ